MRAFLLGCALLLTILAAWPASAQAPVWRFDTDGDMEGWKADNFQSTEVKGGFLQGVTKYDPMLTSPPLSLDAARYPMLEFRVRSSMTGGGEVFWHSAGEGFSEQRMARHMLQAGADPQVYRVDLSALPGWQGAVTGLRLDLLNPAGAEVALDYVRFLTQVPGAVPNESFEDDTRGPGMPDYWYAKGAWWKLSGRGVTDGTRSCEVRIPAGQKETAALVTRAPLDLLGRFALQADVELSDKQAEAAVKLVFYDVFDRPLSVDSIVRLASASGEAKRHLAGTFVAPSRAASADVALEVRGAGVTAWWDNVRLTHVKEEPDLSSAPLETWRASWVWAAETYGKDHCTAYLRKSFELPVAPAQVTEARVQVTADDKYRLYVNGKEVAGSSDTDGWRTPETVDLKPLLVAGRNVLAVQAEDVAAAEGFVLEGWVRAPGMDLEVLTDGSWKGVGQTAEGWQQPGFDDGVWPAVKVIAAAGQGPWGHLPYRYFGPREQLKAVQVTLPAQVAAGGQLTAAVVLDRVPLAAGRFPARSALLQDGKTVLTRGVEPAQGGVAQPTRVGPVTLTLSRFMTAGKYEVALGYPYTGYAGRDGIIIGSVNVTAATQPEAPVRAEIRRHNGLPTLFLNGQPNSFMHYLEINVGATRITNMAQNAGLHLYEVDAGDIGWKGPDQFDYSEWDRRVLELLTYDPQAVIIPTYDVSGLSQRFWIEAHPEELCRDAEGSDKVGIYGSTGKIISLASVRWREAYAVAVRRFTEHCMKAPWGGRVIGYQPCDGVSWEWQHWGSVGGFSPTDYSAPMQEAFREWTRRRYGGDVAKLGQAWAMPEISFEAVQVPSVAQRDGADHLAFRDPGKSGYVIDFYRFYQDVMVDGIEHVFRSIKQVQPRALCGTYYGYTVTMLSGARRAGDSGHYALSRLLNSPLCDFLMSPFDYAARGVGESYTVMSPIGSVLAHDKLWVLQADLRTHLVTEANQRAHGSPDGLGGTVSQLERAFANATAKGSATQWYDFSNGWIARDARQGRVIGKLREIGQQWVTWPDRGPDPNGVAVVVDEDTPAAYMSHDFQVNLWAVYQQKMTFERLGAPWDMVLLDDVVSGRLPKFRCYFFLNCYHMSDSERQWIRQNLQRDGRTLVWTYAPGYVTDGALSVQAMGDLTGMQFSERAETLDWRMALSDTNPLTKGLGTVPQPNMKLGPVFVAQAQPAETAAVWEGTDVPALVVRKVANWTSIYASGPLLSPELLKRICQGAGVPIIVPSAEPSFVSRNMVGLHSATARTETLSFPQPVTVTDLMTGEVLGRKVRNLQVPMAGPQTRLLRVE
ncbi:beta-galactosidase [bacterium]|nr:beta-galactosidase [bacterium]